MYIDRYTWGRAALAKRFEGFQEKTEVIMDIFGYWLHQAMGLHFEEEKEEQEKRRKKKEQEHQDEPWRDQ